MLLRKVLIEMFHQETIATSIYIAHLTLHLPSLLLPTLTYMSVGIELYSAWGMYICIVAGGTLLDGVLVCWYVGVCKLGSIVGTSSQQLMYTH